MSPDQLAALLIAGAKDFHGESAWNWINSLTDLLVAASDHAPSDTEEGKWLDQFADSLASLNSKE